MNDINLQLVREFFELNLFQVLTHWQRDQLPSPEGSYGSQLIVENVQPTDEPPLGVVLRREDIPHLRRALVEVRAWHADRFYASSLRGNPVLRQFAEPAELEQIRPRFGAEDFSTILVVSELPASPEGRQQAIESVQKAGIDHVLEFPTILRHLLDKVNVNGVFTASYTLQTIQLLKRYHLVQNQQMEFDFPLEGALARDGNPAAAPVEVADSAPNPSD